MSQIFSLQFLKSGTQYIAELESGNSIRAGRSIKCDLNLSEHLQGDVRRISRIHFEITSYYDNFFITDLHSVNGTFLNGKKLSPHIREHINDGDVINVANNKDYIIFEITDQLFSTTEVIYLIDDDYNKETALQFDGQDFFIDNQLVPLSLFSQLEEKLLKFLYQNANRACSYHDIAQHVWGGSIGNDSIRTLMKRLRKKMDEIAPNSGERFIKTIHGYGYKMTLD